MCGGTKIVNQPAQIPKPTAEETALQKKNLEYIGYIMPTAFQLADLGKTGISSQQLSPDYRGMYSNMLGNLGRVQSSFSDLMNGKLNSEFTKNREATLQKSMENTMGGMLNNWASRGIIGSTAARDMASDASKNLSSELASGFSSDVALQSQLLEQGQQMAFSPIQYANAAQSAAAEMPLNYFTAATGQYQPSNEAWKTMFGGRYSVATPAQTYAMQSGGGLGGALASGLGTALGSMLFCFPAGTMVSLPDGQKPIEEIKVGDHVLTCTDGLVVYESEVINVAEPGKELPYRVVAGDYVVNSTHNQPLLTPYGYRFTNELVVGFPVFCIKNDSMVIRYITEIEKGEEEVPVYDLSVKWDNRYFANGFTAMGGVV